MHPVQGASAGRAPSRSPSTRCRCDKATEYAAEDADITLRLWQRLKPRLAAEHVTRVYELVDRPLVATIGADGAARDQGRPRLSGASCRGSSRPRSRALEERVYEAAGGPFTIGCPQQLGEVLYERLGLKGGRKGKSGTYSTDVTELERLAGEGRRSAPGWCSTGAS